MKAVVADGAGGLLLSDVEEPQAARDQALIAVDAIGLNRGDLRIAGASKAGARLGWDFLGRIETAVRGGEAAGTRVAGLMLRPGAWAERLAASADQFVAVPDGVADEVTAVLPAAGLTALYMLEEAGPLIGRRLLVTGASGGVGHLACQLAAIGGADVVGLVRSAEGAALLDRLGIASATPETLAGSFDIILDSVGGETFSDVVTRLVPEGLCVAFGVTAGRASDLDMFDFYQQRRRVRGFGLFPAIAAGRPVRAGLARLLALVAAGRLTAEIGHRGTMETIADTAAALMARGFVGKGMLRVRR